MTSRKVRSRISPGMRPTEHDRNLQAVLLLQQSQRLNDSGVIFVRPELSWIEQITFWQTVIVAHPLSLALLKYP